MRATHKVDLRPLHKIEAPHPIEVIGFPTPDSRAPKVKPHYVMTMQIFRALTFLWMREWTRTPDQDRMGLALIGPSGCGKSSSPRQYFGALNCPVGSYTAHKDLVVEDLLFVKNIDTSGATVLDPGPLMMAMMEGHPFVLEEADAMPPGTGTVLNDIAERGMYQPVCGNPIYAERGFLLIITMNTNGAGDVTGTYAGRRRQDRALLGRMLKLEVDFLDDKAQHRLLKEKFPTIEANRLRKFVKVATDIRAQFKAGFGGTLQSGVTPLEAALSERELQAWIELSLANAKAQDVVNPVVMALDWVFANALPPEQREAVRAICKSVFPDAAPAAQAAGGAP